MTIDDEVSTARTFAKIHQKLTADLSNFFWDAFTALAVNGISGDYVEFGSAGATTIRAAHDVIQQMGSSRHMWAFDSFEGLPEPVDPLDVHPAFVPGFGLAGLEGFLASCDAHGIPRQAYSTVVGFYDATLPPLGGDGPPVDIALAYIDCNMYSSTVSVLEFLVPRLKHGMILAFDDYFCWSSDAVSGERAALDELLRNHPEWNLLRFKDPTWGGASFVVERVDHASPRRRP